jgi:hypothetical protein
MSLYQGACICLGHHALPTYHALVTSPPLTSLPQCRKRFSPTSGSILGSCTSCSDPDWANFAAYCCAWAFRVSRNSSRGTLWVRLNLLWALRASFWNGRRPVRTESKGCQKYRKGPAIIFKFVRTDAPNSHRFLKRQCPSPAIQCCVVVSI